MNNGVLHYDEMIPTGPGSPLIIADLSSAVDQGSERICLEIECDETGTDFQVRFWEDETMVNWERGARLIHCYSQLESLKTISDNWNGFGSDAPNEDALNTARDILMTFYEEHFLPKSIVISPSAEEGVTFSISNGKKTAAIESFNSGEIIAVTYDGQDEPNAWEIIDSKKEITVAIGRIHEFIG